MFPILQLGPLAIQVPGLILLAGVWLGLSLAERQASRIDLNPEALYNLVFAGLVGGLIGARLWYASEYLSTYTADPLAILSLNPATLEPMGGLAVGAGVAALYGLRKNLPARPTLDALAPGLAAMGIAFALAHLASGDAFGAPARLPWSIFLWDDYRHPSQVYELAGAIGVMAAWRWTRDRKPFEGFGFLLVVALSSAARVFLEAFRGDSVLIAGGLRAAQVWATLLLALCLALMRRGGRSARPSVGE